LEIEATDEEATGNMLYDTVDNFEVRLEQVHVTE